MNLTEAIPSKPFKLIATHWAAPVWLCVCFAGPQRGHAPDESGFGKGKKKGNKREVRL